MGTSITVFPTAVRAETAAAMFAIVVAVGIVPPLTSLVPIRMTLMRAEDATAVGTWPDSIVVEVAPETPRLLEMSDAIRPPVRTRTQEQKPIASNRALVASVYLP